MSELSLLTEYVDRVFKLYGADRLGFFEDFDGDSADTVEIPLFRPSEADDETLSRISIYLGLTKQEILGRDEAAAKRYWDKYPFFQLHKEYKKQWWWHSRYKVNEDALKRIHAEAEKNAKQPDVREKNTLTLEEMIAKIKREKLKPSVIDERYDQESVKIRLVEKLREIDAVMPGAFHERAEITALSISTEVFFSFPKCSEMLRSYIDMVERAGELFFRAVFAELTEEEACELNFLASRLDAKDSLASDTLVTYENVRLLREIYAQENLPCFMSYVKFTGLDAESPWRCREFFDDMELVQKFVNIFPRSKAQMREFCMSVKKFACTFIWSDAKPVTGSLEEEALDFELFGGYDELYVPIEKRGKESTLIYVDKTADEMFDWEESAKKLSRAASPAAMGGLELPPGEMVFSPAGPETLPRMQKRIAAKRGGGR